MDPFRELGRVVAVPLGALARLLQAKPMHPRGAVFDGVLDRHGLGAPSGITWLDEVATDDVVVRLSRGAGLPAPLPDVLGLALRQPADGDGEPVDLLLSTTGRGPLTRLLPRPGSDAESFYSSIMGYRSDAGTVRLAALPGDAPAASAPAAEARRVERDGLEFVLAAARGSGPWRPFARLRLRTANRPLDPDVRFDAVRHPPPGLVPDGPMARFRSPAYAAARAARS